ncbi:dynein heavy chain, n-terminal region 2 protein, partial [Toxoplasma gondii ME49]
YSYQYIYIYMSTDAMKPQHWRHLMELRGCEFEVDSKKFKLQNVFDLDLSRFPDQVQNVLQTAQEEMKLEKDIAKIESHWRAQTLDMCRYKTEEQSFVLRANEELHVTLEDHILQLQSMVGSRFASVVIEKIRKWEKTLNNIREVFEAWLQVRSGSKKKNGGKQGHNTLVSARKDRARADRRDHPSSKCCVHASIDSARVLGRLEKVCLYFAFICARFHGGVYHALELSP